MSQSTELNEASVATAGVSDGRSPPPSHGQQIPALGDLDVQLTGLLLSVLAPPHQLHSLNVVYEVGSAGKHMLPQEGVSNYITVPNLGDNFGKVSSLL